MSSNLIYPSENIYYVYQLIDPRDMLPFYIGKGHHPKGKTDRIDVHFHPCQLKKRNKKNSKIKAIHNIGLEVIRQKIVTGLSEKEAFDLEIKMIAECQHELTNMTSGGEGGTTKNRIYMNNGKHNKLVEEVEIYSYECLGWVKGKLFSEKEKNSRSESCKRNTKLKGIVVCYDLEGNSIKVSKEEYHTNKHLYRLGTASEESSKKKAIALTKYANNRPKEHNEKVAAALNKYPPLKCCCCSCGKVFDIGNFTKHLSQPHKCDANLFLHLPV